MFLYLEYLSLNGQVRYFFTSPLTLRILSDLSFEVNIMFDCDADDASVAVTTPPGLLLM